ncbi:hypothetical protein L596_022629 [Steinernema carpocapsae]|uniref:Uncharacterized protein n=1 Tax=Steinernema carpocapsae TaxID=34508 RepID=A0A4U5MMB6_STECR|nr:hypothetical protein L596_022629 [Steinernema carpocapsae]
MWLAAVESQSICLGDLCGDNKKCDIDLCDNIIDDSCLKGWCELKLDIENKCQPLPPGTDPTHTSAVIVPDPDQAAFVTPLPDSVPNPPPEGGNRPDPHVVVPDPGPITESPIEIPLPDPNPNPSLYLHANPQPEAGNRPNPTLLLLFLILEIEFPPQMEESLLMVGVAETKLKPLQLKLH